MIHKHTKSQPTAQKLLDTDRRKFLSASVNTFLCVYTGIQLTACGGSSGNSSTSDDPLPDPKVEQPVNILQDLNGQFLQTFNGETVELL